MGFTLIDTAEAYKSGGAEEMIGRVIAGQRSKVFLVSKVSPNHATADGIRKASTASLARLGTDYLDLYLLHAPPRVHGRVGTIVNKVEVFFGGASDLSVVVDTFESLRVEGRIRRWGVSNFLVEEMEALYRVHGAGACTTNQVRYNLKDRSIEHDMLPWCQQHGMPVMGYSPLGSGDDLLQNKALAQVAERHQSSPSAIALAWTIRSGHVISITESGSSTHVRQNAEAFSLQLTDLDLDELSRGFG